MNQSGFHGSCHKGFVAQVHIGSVHPERDFERWLNERKTGGVDVVGPAIE